MSEKINEFLSAMLDDEADEFEIRRVLSEVSNNSGLKSKWSRYHLVSSVLKGEGLSNLEELDLGDVSTGDIGPSSRRETVKERKLNKPWLPGRGTLAASLVAVIAVLTIVFARNDEGAKQLELADSLVVPDLVAKDERLPTESDIRRAEAYLIQHAQNASMNSSVAPIPFIKVIAHQAEK